MVNWSAHSKRTLLFNCNNTKQARQRRVKRLLMSVKACKACVLMIDKARRRVGCVSMMDKT